MRPHRAAPQQHKPHPSSHVSKVRTFDVHAWPGGAWYYLTSSLAKKSWHSPATFVRRTTIGSYPNSLAHSSSKSLLQISCPRLNQQEAWSRWWGCGRSLASRVYPRKLNPRKLCNRHSAKILLLENFPLYGICLNLIQPFTITMLLC